MDTQEKLFYDSYFEALRDDVNACGGPKAVGEWFWAEKSIEARRNMVNDRLNGERRDRFTDEQERLIMRRARERCGFSAALAYVCDETGFERPRPLNLADEKAELERAFIDSVRRQEQIADRMERLTRSPIAVVNKHA